MISYVRARAEALGMKLPPLFMRRAERLLLTLLVFVVAALASSSDRSSGVLAAGLGLLGILQAVGAGPAPAPPIGSTVPRPSAAEVTRSELADSGPAGTTVLTSAAPVTALEYE